MTLTLLIDLDDTLLSNDFGNFLPVYLTSLGDHLARYAAPEQLIPKLLDATQRMIQNKRPDRNLKEIFDHAFYPSLGLEIEDMQEAFDVFYADVFPTLQRLTCVRPEAVELVEQILAQGNRVVIATNPLFPRTAIMQRLDWAGISPQKYPLSLITSYETFHFTKPNPAYFAEILARLGWPEGAVVMIGDDLQNDIFASRRLGLPAFWITSTDAPTPKPDAPTESGSLADFLNWLDTTSLEELQPEYNSPDALLAIMLATPAALDSMIDGLPIISWTERPQPREWSLTEIICHLRDVDSKVNIPRLKKVIQESNPFLPGMDTDLWAEEHQYISQDGQSAITAFTTARMQLLEILEDFNQDDWHRPARHAIFGPTNLMELISITAGHDRLHIHQIHRVLNIFSHSSQDPSPQPM